MAITLVQSTNATTGTLTLNGVAAGNLLVFVQTYFRSSGTYNGSPLTAPTDTVGTWASAANGTPARNSAGPYDQGAAIFYMENAASGSHTTTPNGTSDWQASLMEFSGIVTSSALDGTANNATNGSAHTSIATGTTAATVQPIELVVIACGLACSPGGVADVAWTDPVSGFTTQYKVSNDASDVATLIGYKTISVTGTQSATFNWTDSEAGNFSAACIATFKARTASPPMFRGS